MIDRGTVRLETERLILRKFALDDARDMFNNWANDDEVTQYLVWPSHAGLKASQEVIGSWLADYADPRQYLWALEFKPDAQAVGSLGVVGRRPGVGGLVIGYCLGRSYWGRGLMAEALGVVRDFLLDQVEADFLEARVDPRNRQSARVLIKCGFELDRVEVDGGQNNLGRYDAQIYRINRFR